MGPLRDRLDLLPHVLFQFVGTFSIWSALVVILAAVVEYEAGIPDEVLGGRILVRIQLRLHCAEIHGFLDDIVIVGHVVLVDRNQERPAALVIL